MQDSSIIGWIANGLMGIVLYFMKTTIKDIKEDLAEQRQKLEKVKETYTTKEDYLSFKTELWSRLDEMKADFLRALDKK